MYIKINFLCFCMYVGHFKLIPWSVLSICEISHDEVRVFIFYFYFLLQKHYEAHILPCYNVVQFHVMKNVTAQHDLPKITCCIRCFIPIECCTWQAMQVIIFFLSKLFTMYALIQTNVFNWNKSLYNWNSSCHIKISLRPPSYSLGTQKSENNSLTI